MQPAPPHHDPSMPGAVPRRPTPSTQDCPPTPARREDLDFEPHQPMVDWFSPTELVRAGVKALLSSLFGAYADKREVQALQGASEVYDYTQNGPLWIDYVADLGDGFDATYTVARLLAEETLPLDGGHTTQRGRLLVMGGDQVYPTATREEYNNRLVGPYRAALPCVLPADAAPHLFAIPGNHDWYDGLTSFTRLFCQRRWIGGWKTQQTRSYFALRLSRRWWLWGLDVQLSSDVDLPQLNYFEMVARDFMERDSLIILCSAEPTWVTVAHEETAYDNLAYFEEKTMTPYGHSLMLGLAGDLHTYARYEQQAPSQPLAPKQRFISGGGGAYLYPTHDLPRKLTLPDPTAPDDAGPSPETYALENREGQGDEACSVFPDIPESRALTLSNLLFGLKNWKLSLFFGGFYLFFAWIFRSTTGLAFFEYIATTTSFFDVGRLFFEALLLSPASVLLLVLLWGGLVGYADTKGLAKVALGTLHTALHVLLLLGLMWGLVRLFPSMLAPGVQGGDVAFVAAIMLIGGLAGGTLMGIYLLLANQFWGVHSNEVLLGQRLTSYKNFLRLRLNPDETLSIYPIGIRKVCRDWQFNPAAPRGTAWFASATWDRRRPPDAPERKELYQLIEGPIHLTVPPPTNGAPSAPSAETTEKSAVPSNP